MLQAESSILVARFMISLKNGFKYKLNCPNWRGQISHRWDFVSILGFLAQLGKVLTWDHQIWNLLKRMHLLIPTLSIFGKILYSTKTSPFSPVLKMLSS